MNKSRFLVFFFLLSGLGISSLWPDIPAKTVISILFFDNLTENPDFQWMGRSLSDGLTVLLKNDFLILVEREHLEDVIEEQKLSLSGLTDESTALEIGKILNTSHLIRGSFVVRQGRVRATAKVTDTESGEILYSISSEKKTEQYFELERELAEGLALFYQISLPEEEERETDSLDALNSYYEGLVLMDAEAYEAAADSFREAISRDPSYLKPRESLEESYRFLKDFRKARYQREINTLYNRLVSLLKRADTDPFVSYSDWVVKAMDDGMSGEDISAYTREHPEITWGNTRAETLWHAQNVMMEIAGYGVEYFEDEGEADRMYGQMIAVSQMAQAEMPEDPFLNELIYQELLAWRYRENWTRVLQVCEMLMLGWPDFRMMWAVEGFYEDALTALE